MRDFDYVLIYSSLVYLLVGILALLKCMTANGIDDFSKITNRWFIFMYLILLPMVTFMYLDCRLGDYCVSDIHRMDLTYFVVGLMAAGSTVALSFTNNEMRGKPYFILALYGIVTILHSSMDQQTQIDLAVRLGLIALHIMYVFTNANKLNSTFWMMNLLSIMFAGASAFLHYYDSFNFDQFQIMFVVSNALSALCSFWVNYHNDEYGPIS
jgi:hypothetical protein